MPYFCRSIYWPQRGIWPYMSDRQRSLVRQPLHCIDSFLCSAIRTSDTAWVHCLGCLLRFVRKFWAINYYSAERETRAAIKATRHRI